MIIQGNPIVEWQKFSKPPKVTPKVRGQIFWVACPDLRSANMRFKKAHAGFMQRQRLLGTH